MKETIVVIDVNAKKVFVKQKKNTLPYHLIMQIATSYNGKQQTGGELDDQNFHELPYTKKLLRTKKYKHKP